MDPISGCSKMIDANFTDKGWILRTKWPASAILSPYPRSPTPKMRVLEQWRSRCWGKATRGRVWWTCQEQLRRLDVKTWCKQDQEHNVQSTVVMMSVNIIDHALWWKPLLWKMMLLTPLMMMVVVAAQAAPVVMIFWFHHQREGSIKLAKTMKHT